MVDAADAVEAIEPDAVVEFETPEIEALDEGIIESGALEEIVEALEDKVTEPVAVETTPEVVDADVDAALVAMTPS